MKTENLTWSEVLGLPLGTKVRRGSWVPTSYIYLFKDHCDSIIIRDERDHKVDFNLGITLQNDFQIYGLNRKEYMAGKDALEHVYSGGAVALDSVEWLSEFHKLRLGCCDVRPYSESGETMGSYSKRYYDQNKWYKVK